MNPATPGLAARHMELSRSTSGQWSLFADGERVARTRDQGMGDAAAKEWAEAVTGCRRIEWAGDPARPGRWLGRPVEDGAP